MAVSSVAPSSSPNVERSGTEEAPLPRCRPDAPTGGVYALMLALTIFAGLQMGLLLLDISPILPLVRAQYGASYVEAGLAVSATLVAHMVAVAFTGIVADRIGPRPILLAGLVFLAGSAVARAFASNFELLLASRAVTGLGTGCIVIGGLTAVTLLSPPERRIRDQGYVGAAQQLGVMFTLLVAPVGVPALGITDYWILLALEVSIPLVLCALFFPRRRGTHGASVRPRPVAMLRDGYGWLLTLANMCGYGVFVGVTAWTASFLIERYHTSPEETALLTGGATLFAFLGRLVAGPLVRLLGAHWLIGGFVALTAASLIAAPFAPDATSAALVLLAFSLGSSVPFGAVFGSVADRPARAGIGQRFTLITINSNLVALLLPPLIGYSIGLTGDFVAGFTLIGALVGVVALVLLRSSLGRSQNAKEETRGWQPIQS